MRACLQRQRSGCEDNLGLGTSNGHSSSFHGSVEKVGVTNPFVLFKFSIFVCTQIASICYTN
ncbi:hypothetical protein TELCIR_00391 [Teladorsagia circumcincta]|uniref:Uncharacterized protein n=1 Tax=Teladorsagia circumcincta TaxID=45464 RepID=A0A2G9V4V7_TELCI|nr:hypothetical protein TELCIR_00391 [Teladorsagia circumcincta]